MLLGHIFNFTIISGIFKKRNEDLDVLPPPPPFPEIWVEEKTAKEADRARKQQERQGLKGEEKDKRELEKQKAKQEKRGKKKLKGKRAAKKEESLMGPEIDELKILSEISQSEIQAPAEEPKKISFFEKIFGRKKEEEGFEKELEEIESGITGKSKIQELEFTPEQPERGIIRPKDALDAGEEIQKAIEGMAQIKIPSKFHKLFKKKGPTADTRKAAGTPDSLSPNYAGKIETPEVMPKTYDKIDNVELIEEKMHKARLALMNFKFDEAKRIYIEIMKKYNELDIKDKTKVYQDIKDLYYERKSAEKFAK